MTLKHEIDIIQKVHESIKARRWKSISKPVIYVIDYPDIVKSSYTMNDDEMAKMSLHLNLLATMMANNFDTKKSFEAILTKIIRNDISSSG